jgi:membrane carboxypeptidase/penicillin-binding protein
MALKITCPHCRSPRRLGEPFPVPGTEVQCDACGRALAISYPPGMVERLQAKGLRFTDSPSPSPAASPGSPAAPQPAEPPPRTEQSPSAERPPDPADPAPLFPPKDHVSEGFTPLLPEGTSPDSPTVAMRRMTEPTADTGRDEPTRPDEPSDDLPTEEHITPSDRPASTAGERRPEVPMVDRSDRPRRLQPDPTAPRTRASQTSPPSHSPPPDRAKRDKKAGKRRPPRVERTSPRTPKEKALLTLKWIGLSVFFVLTLGLGAVAWWMAKSPRTWVKAIGIAGVIFGGTCIVAAMGGAVYAKMLYDEWTQDLPSVEEIADYYPPTVTTIYDANGQVMGELYDPDAEGGGRRYVVPIGCPWGDALPPADAESYDCIPQVVQDAFIAAEDAKFMEHSGVDYEGVLRAVVRNAIKGKKAQGASTITMQVARNMPALKLTKEKKFSRKVREVVLAQRMEEAFDKEYILFLYLNQIYLGSQAYGVEAASRVYFGKSVGQLGLAEAAILAGLPQRPHDYSPHINWESARTRQEYVLKQMMLKDFISESEYDDAMDQRVLVVKRDNEFLRQAPYFTEEVKRYLEKAYGREKVYQDGLKVYTTCNLDLQKSAQKAVKEHALWADKRRGWRGGTVSLRSTIREIFPSDRDLSDFLLDMTDDGEKPIYNNHWVVTNGEVTSRRLSDVTLEKRSRALEDKALLAHLGLGGEQGLVSTQLQQDRRLVELLRFVQQRVPEDAIQRERDAYDLAIREAIAKRQIWVADPNNAPGYDPLPDSWDLQTIEEGMHPSDKEIYDAIVMTAEKTHVTAAIGRYLVVIPVEWTWWARPPNPGSSWTSSRHDIKDMSKLLETGDRIQVRLRSPDEPDRAEEYRTSSGGTYYPRPKQSRIDELRALEIPFAELHQDTDLQAAILSYRLEDGAIRAMVGGVDWAKSQYNRAMQGRRQVGSTIKPIVYTAAIDQGYYHAASRVTDQAIAVPTILGQYWRPGNYGEKYEGSMTMRKALQKSKNVCTVQIMQRTGVDAVFDLAATKLRIGYDEPVCLRTHMPEEEVCSGDTSPSAIEGMKWCSVCDPTTCPLTLVPEDASQCLDEPVTRLGEQWCHSCSPNMRLCSWLPAPNVDDLSECQDAQIVDDEVLCRSCDLSMGLGSSALTMLELAQGYSAFPTGGKRVTPHFIRRVVDGDSSGTVIEEWTPPEGGWPQVIDPEVAGLGHWLVYQVAHGGTGTKAGKLAHSRGDATVGIAGKTGTTNDFNDAWFVGYNPETITAAWVGHDLNERLGWSSTGGATAMPIWMEFMAAAHPKLEDASEEPRFEEWAAIQGDPERFRWRTVEENPNSDNFGRVITESSQQAGVQSVAPRTMPFKRKAGSEVWNMPGEAQAISTTTDSALEDL